jgi:hypothetical protein
LGPSPGSRRAVSSEDVHTAATLLKMFFRELKSPILTEEVYDQVMSASANEKELGRLAEKIGEVFSKLPSANYDTLGFLAYFLGFYAT